MALLGHVTSTALTGSDSPVFERAGVDAVVAVGKKQDAVQLQLEAQAAQIKSLTDALTSFLAANTPAPEPTVPLAELLEPVEPVVEPVVELTPQEKANITKAAKKAALEATSEGE